ncbi:hypothetical protein AC579_6567 [Pseudocercospora musae]|uniref:Uncharacterized protein n=1 Tax=Pseudocercospora musae TaxID=113226 RepID=A0A139I1P3_9PEZI|nr:hypothetical protein AC579_6567 [Pseudocercospora musae]KXT08630.1 hypothetical protein AC579_6567 [Pseudocercospora musae]
MASVQRQYAPRSDGVTPTHAVAVMVGNAANIVWINRDRYICVYTAPAGTEKDRAESNAKYILTAPRIDNRPVQVRACDPRLATIDYTDENDGAEMWRIYYFNEHSYLCEIKSDGEGGWERGSLDDQQLQVAEKSPLAAVVDGGDVKVYFQPKDKAALYVTWSPKGPRGQWSTPSCMTDSL